MTSVRKFCDRTRALQLAVEHELERARRQQLRAPLRRTIVLRHGHEALSRPFSLIL